MEKIIEVYIRENDVDTLAGPETVEKLFTDSSQHYEDSYLSESETSTNGLEITKRKRSIKTTEDGNTPPKKRMYTQKYRKEWESMTTYKPWLSESVLGNLFFYCKFCKSNYKCGKTEIDKHMICKKHIRNSKVPQVRVQKKFNFRGLMCPVFTPFIGRDREINYEIIPMYARYLLSAGVNGVLINDIIGEGMSLTLPERMRLIDEWVKVCDETKQHLMVQIGGAPLKDVLEMVRYAERRKVGSVTILPDLYNKPKDHFDLMRYIKLVTDQANSIPLLYHHNPTYTGVNIDITKFLNDILGEIDSFIGVIFSDNNLKDATSALQVNEDKFIVFMGSDEILLGSSVNGFTSFISSSSNFVPRLTQNILEKTQVGEIMEARTYQKSLLNILESIYRHGEWLPTMKAAMNILSRIEVGLVRDPLVSIWQDKVNKMKQDLHHLKIL